MDITVEIGKYIFNHRVAGVMIKSNHVLIHRGFGEDKWAFPGGCVKVGERNV